MAFLQSDLPPSTAPGASAAIARPRNASPRPSDKHSLPVGRIGAALLAAALLILLGAAAARATESLAVGIMAADLAFLVAVAAWSAVAGGARR